MELNVIKAMSPAMRRSYGALLLQDRMFKVTQGPWMLFGNPSQDIRFAQSVHAGSEEVAKIRSLPSAREDEALANAKLIAAAPLMAKAAFLSLALLCDRFPHEHGCADVGLAWGALDEALRLAFE